MNLVNILKKIEFGPLCHTWILLGVSIFLLNLKNELNAGPPSKPVGPVKPVKVVNDAKMPVEIKGKVKVTNLDKVVSKLDEIKEVVEQGGINCWDLNENRECDTDTEDIDNSGDCNVLDCRSPAPSLGDCPCDTEGFRQALSQFSTIEFDTELWLPSSTVSSSTSNSFSFTVFLEDTEGNPYEALAAIRYLNLTTISGGTPVFSLPSRECDLSIRSLDGNGNFAYNNTVGNATFTELDVCVAELREIVASFVTTSGQ